MKRMKRLLCLVLVTLLMVGVCAGTVAAEEMRLAGTMPDINDVKIVDIQTGLHTLALDENGNVWAWGLNNYGQWGVGFIGEAPAYMYVQVLDLSDVVQIETGASSSYALCVDGTVWAWGNNNSGQLGDGTTITRSIPKQVNGLNNVREIAAGAHHCLALKEDGTIWSWGRGGGGLLGNGNTQNQTNPVQMIDLEDIISVAAGEYHSLALRQDGTVWACGSSSYGQLGINISSGFRSTPVQVQRILNIKEIAAGQYHSTATKDDGTVWIWGDNSVGQIGDNTTVNRLVPVQLQLTNIHSVTSGGYRNFAQSKNGQLWSWGYNYNGELCFEDNINRLTPTEMPIEITYILSANNDSTIFIKADGSIWGCGRNQHGQLRMDTSTTTVITPIRLFGPGTYVGPGIGPIDPPDPTQHTITLIERYADGTPDVTTTYDVDDGDPFTTTYHSTGAIQSFEVSAADARVRADYAARTIEIDKVDRDITVILTFDEGGGAPEPGEVTLTNMVQAADFSDLSPWYLSPDNASMQVEGDALAVTIDSADSMYYLTLRQDMQMDPSHKYYVRSDMCFDEASFPGATTLEVRLQLGNNSLEAVRASGWTTISTIGSPSHNGMGRFQQLYRFGPTGSYQGGVMKSREPLVIDLTEAFGAGSEPSVAWCDENIPFFAGTTTVAAPASFVPASAGEQAARGAALQPDAGEPEAAPGPGAEAEAAAEAGPEGASQPETDMREPEEPEPVPEPDGEAEPQPEPKTEE